MTIICGTDFSDRSIMAGRAAAAIARRLGERLELVHVVEGLGAEDAVAGHAPELEPQRARLGELAAELERTGVRVEPLLRGGPADEALVTRAKEMEARLVVVSSLGKSKRARWLIGSVAERTAQASPAPVLVARDGATLEAWARGERRLRVLVGTDLQATSQAALGWIEELRAIGPCDVTALHLAWPLREHARLGVEGPAPLDRLRPEVEEPLRREFEACLRRAPGEVGAGIERMLRPSVGRVDRDLVRAAEEIGADLIVVGSHQRAGLDRLIRGSVARGVLHAAPMSVACVPADASLEAALGEGAAGGNAGEGDRIPAARRILAATDFSPSGDAAVSLAFSLAPEGGEVRLFHALAEGEEPAEAEARLRALASGHAGPARTTVFEVSRERRPADAICHAAERSGADLVCVGTRARGGLARVALGSVAQEVVERARRPVLVAPTPREG